jgi:hypothetical protein
MSLAGHRRRLPAALRVSRPSCRYEPSAKGCDQSTRNADSWGLGTPCGRRAERSQSVPKESLALRMFPKVFPSGMKTAPGVISGGRFY